MFLGSTKAVAGWIIVNQTSEASIEPEITFLRNRVGPRGNLIPFFEIVASTLLDHPAKDEQQTAKLGSSTELAYIHLILSQDIIVLLLET
jgi:hypothetical protein